MLIRKLVILILCYCPPLIAAIPYFVSLKTSETLDSFLKYDINYPSSQNVKALISQYYSIGNFTGFSGDFSKSIIDRLKRCPLIAEITPDITIKAFDFEVQDDAPRHLARLSQASRIGDSDLKYFYDSSATGKGVNAYVLDSGVEIEHPEFEGRAKFGIDFTKEGSGDVNGHGTHVAGIIGSKTYGVSKDVEIIEIKALDQNGVGTLSTVIAAIEFAVNHRRRGGRHGVANLSLGAAKNNVLNKAIDAAVQTGLIMVVAAGNSNVNACMTSPASAPAAITVGAINDAIDTLASFSNWGECVDIFASGTYVTSVNAHDFNYPQVLSGTSMSAPVVTGLIANLLSKGVPPASIKETVIKTSIKNRISRPSMMLRRRTPNRIAYNGIDIEHIEVFPSSDSDIEEE